MMYSTPSENPVPHRVVAEMPSIRRMLPMEWAGTFRSQLTSPYRLPSTKTQMGLVFALFRPLGLRLISQFGRSARTTSWAEAYEPAVT